MRHKSRPSIFAQHIPQRCLHVNKKRQTVGKAVRANRRGAKIVYGPMEAFKARGPAMFCQRT